MPASNKPRKPTTPAPGRGKKPRQAAAAPPDPAPAGDKKPGLVEKAWSGLNDIQKWLTAITLTLGAIGGLVTAAQALFPPAPKPAPAVTAAVFSLADYDAFMKSYVPGVAGSPTINDVRNQTRLALSSQDAFSKADILHTLYERNLIRKTSDPRVSLDGADLEGVALFNSSPLPDIDLRGAVLKRADLTNVDIQGADLTGARLNEAQMRSARLDHADLTQADLEGANLTQTILQGAILKGANLTGATLKGADFSQALLRDADFHGVKDAASAIFAGADLTAADFSYADLRGAHLGDDQLKQLKALVGTWMPDGKCYDGRFRLAADDEFAKTSGVNPADPAAMTAFFQKQCQ